MSEQKTPRDSEFDKAIDDRNRILVALDIEGARPMMPNATDEVILIALHKARYEVATIPHALRVESGDWLKERGYKRMFNQEFLSDGLPT